MATTTSISTETALPSGGPPSTRLITYTNGVSVTTTAGSTQSTSTSDSASGTNTAPSPSAASPSRTSNTVATLLLSTSINVALEPCPSQVTPASQLCSNSNSTPIIYVLTTQTLATNIEGPDGLVTSSYGAVSYVPSLPQSAIISTTNASTSNPGTSVSSTTSSSTPTSSSPSSQHGGVSTATLAGAAIGCLIAGALIAGLVAFFLLKKRARKDRYVSRNTYVPAANPAYGGEKGTPMVSIASAGTMDFLPQQADDAEVSRKISTVVDQIDQHVENFYGNRGAPMDANREAEISRFETSELPLPLAACFQNSGAPMTLIKHCLAYHIFNLTMSPSEHTMPLLPVEIAGVVTAMYHKSLSPAASKDTITAFSTWKSLTRYLRPDLGRDASTARTLSESSAHFATHFTNVFSPWAHAQYSNDTRARHLTELINQAVQTAIWLFGQPDNYKFEWDLPNTRQNANYSAVIIPAVWKTTHGGMRLNNKGQNVLSPAIKGF